MMPRMFTADNRVGSGPHAVDGLASMMPRMFTADNPDRRAGMTKVNLLQ